MYKSQIIISIIAIALVIGIFLLPKVVVNTEKDIALSEEEHHENDGHDHSNDKNAVNTATAHNRNLSEEEEKTIFRLRESYINSKEKEKSAKFADSLAIVYRNASKYDSAAKYSEVVAEIYPNEDNLLRAGDNYFEAFSYSVDPAVLGIYGEKARGYFSKVLERKPGLLEIKNKVAMTYIASANPMQGILLLREVLDADPVNEQAMFNLGILSIQSAQYDKAVDRFEKLVSIYPDNIQAQFYLGLGYLKSGNKIKAKEQFELVKNKDNDPEFQATVNTYLEEIK